ncbi:MAG: thioredoxin domain-containing protein [Armatimonadetes bacterium]|nr:thioredoxin domain-containing protein [Armatimonadota bacterium]
MTGKRDGPFTLLEYGDYECPFCGRAHIEVKRLLEDAGDEVKFSFRNFPLSEIHPHAKSAALAAEAAARQGRFWPMHDLLLENQRDLRAEKILDLADSLGLDLERFEGDVRTQELSERVHEDFMMGVRSGVNGTPTFFVNGLRHNGPAEYASLIQALREQPL